MDFTAEDAEDAEGSAPFPPKGGIAAVGRHLASGVSPLPRNDKRARPAPAFRLSLRAARSAAKQSPASTGATRSVFILADAGDCFGGYAPSQ